ncbi:MAG TPA: hypothetical protein VFV75_11670 [Candidatus Polarisedimenticolaceae bacterium]|nr:hypothetical protein [Candidatus Polarisedimenticolaceae bacterium]
MSSRRGRAKAFVVETFDLRVKPGVDPDRMNQLVDALEVAERGRKYER